MVDYSCSGWVQGFLVYPNCSYCMLIYACEASPVKDVKDAIRVNQKALGLGVHLSDWKTRMICRYPIIYFGFMSLLYVRLALHSSAGTTSAWRGKTLESSTRWTSS